MLSTKGDLGAYLFPEKEIELGVLLALLSLVASFSTDQKHIEHTLHAHIYNPDT